MTFKTTSSNRIFLLNYLAIFFLLLVALVPSRSAFALPALFQDELVKSGLNQPTSMAFLPDGRVLVTQKFGQIFILDPRVISPVLDPYLTITDINTGGERGLLDIVLDPAFPAQPYIYVVYHRESDKRIFISRFTHQGNTASVDSEFVVWKDPNLYTHPFHHGGGLSFGPDGHLYLTTGEQFNGLVAQDFTKAGGKIIRIARDGTIPADNPYVGPDGKLDEIWAIGLRNPFRARWDLGTTGSIGPRLFIGEVGGNLGSSNEDIHIGKKGANFGWPYCEGMTCNNSNQVYDAPLFTYEHLNKGASVIGGIVYHGNQFPDFYSGVYFYGDYAKWVAGKRGIIRYLTFDSNGAVSTDNAFLEGGAGLVVDVKEGRDGALYYLEVASSENFLANTGALNRVIYNDGNQAPQITSATANVTNGGSPLTVQFSSTATDAENDNIQYLWVFGDGEQAEGANVSHTYTTNGSYQAKVQVSDDNKTTTSNPSITITVGAEPQVTITQPIDGATFRAGENISFAATATDDGILTEDDYKWTILFVHNLHTHPEQGPITGSSGTLHTPNSGHSFFDETGFEVSVEVTDQDGVSTNKKVRIFPEKVDITFNSQPSGISFFIDGTVISTPMVYDTAIGFIHNLTAPQTTCLNGNQKYKFVNWSNEAAASHNYTIPDHDETLTANYVADGTCDANTNLSPLAFADEITMANNASRIINVLENDTDSDSNLDKSTVTVVRQPQHGQVSVDNVTGSITYSHDGSAMTKDSFTYTVKDEQGAVSNEASVLIDITGTDTGGGTATSCGSGLDLDGTNDWVNIPNLTLAHDFTVEGWVKLAPGIDNKDAMFGQEGGGPDINFHDGKVRLYAYGDRVKANTALLPDTWGHVAITRSGSNLKLYINGVQDATGSWNGSLSLKTIGRGNRGYFGGMLDEIRIWDIARTGAEIGASHNGSVDPNSTGLIGYWSFNETDQTITDSSDSENHGSLGVNVSAGSDDPVRLASNAPFTENCDGGNTGGNNDGNTAPVASNDTVGSVQAGGVINFTVTDNDVDSDGNLDLNSISIVSQPSHGIATVNASGVINYTHNGSNATTDSLTYTVNDTEGAVSNSAIVSITVTGTIPTGSSIIIDEFNNSNPVGTWEIQQPARSNFSYSVTPEKITMTGSSNTQNLTRINTDIDPARPYSMRSTFIFNSSAGVNAYAMLFMQENKPTSDQVNAWGMNLDLLGKQIKYMGFKNGIFIKIGSRTASWAEANKEYVFQADVNRRIDGSFSPKWVTVKFMDTSGTVLEHFEVDYDHNKLWQPNLNETVRIGLNSHGADWEARNILVEYTDTDDQGTGNQFPIAKAGADQMVIDSNADGSELITLDGGLSSDPDGDNLTYSWRENSNTLGAGQTINHSFDVGVHVVTLTVNDGQGHEVSDAVIITVNENVVDPINNAPTAQGDTATVQAGEAVIIDVLANDNDSDGTLNESSLLIVNVPSNGTVNIDTTGVITYSHDGSASTNDSFTYTVADDQGDVSSEATVTVSITHSPVASCSKGMELDGVNDWVNIPNLTLANDFTVEGWVKLAPGINNKDAMFGQEGGGPDINFHDGKVRLYAYGDRVKANTAILADTWTHVAITRSGTNLMLYINGVEDATGNWNGSLSLKAIGRGTRGYFGGMLDEFRIWDVARTGAEISTSYNASVDPNAVGLIGYWPFNEADQIVTDASNSANHGSLGVNLSAGADDPVYQISNAPFTENCDGTNTGGGNSEPPVVTNEAPVANNDTAGPIQAGGSISHTVTGNDVDSDSNLDPTSVLITSDPSHGEATVNASGIISYTNMGTEAVTDTLTYTVKDTEGAVSNAATLSISVTATDTSTGGGTNTASSCGTSLELDGANDWINIPNLTLASDFTIEGWVKLASGIDNKDAIFGQEGGGPDVNFFGGKVRLYAYGDRVTANTAILPDTWSHIAITRSSSKLTLYINGIEDATGSWNGALSVKAIGRGNRGFFKGNLDEFRIWNVARTGAEISASYNTSVDSSAMGLIGYWSFNETDQIVTDFSGTANHGSLGSSTTVGADDPTRQNSGAPFSESCN